MKMKYPAEKRRTAATVQKMREAELALDSFWQSTDEYYRDKTGKILDDLFADLLSPRPLYRTPEWVESSPPSLPEDNTETDFASSLQIPYDSPVPQVSPVSARLKTKAKTRGTPMDDNDAYLPVHYS